MSLCSHIYTFTEPVRPFSTAFESTLMPTPTDYANLVIGVLDGDTKRVQNAIQKGANLNGRIVRIDHKLSYIQSNHQLSSFHKEP